MNIKYKQIIVIAIASIMIFSGFLILISQSSRPVEKNKKIIFNDISSSNVNYDFSFLNSTQYNKSDIIIIYITISIPAYKNRWRKFRIWRNKIL